ncbi:hypothetical protein [Streptomyces sp. HB132]|uniref:hypothetical protein n=1 Tax=Streptomyces sp. HB132 TaxID=767388 RepID=UPI00195FF01F|nr:hypothetical protein [Streptomyces sp. HB132]MBM7437575.1 hypothetical protein [Streptomyces sp. HB132]
MDRLPRSGVPAAAGLDGDTDRTMGTAEYDDGEQLALSRGPAPGAEEIPAEDTPPGCTGPPGLAAP